MAFYNPQSPVIGGITKPQSSQTIQTEMPADEIERLHGQGLYYAVLEGKIARQQDITRDQWKSLSLEDQVRVRELLSKSNNKVNFEDDDEDGSTADQHSRLALGELAMAGAAAATIKHHRHHHRRRFKPKLLVRLVKGIWRGIRSIFRRIKETLHSANEKKVDKPNKENSIETAKERAAEANKKAEDARLEAERHQFHDDGSAPETARAAREAKNAATLADKELKAARLAEAASTARATRSLQALRNVRGGGLAGVAVSIVAVPAVLWTLVRFGRGDKVSSNIATGQANDVAYDNLVPPEARKEWQAMHEAPDTLGSAVHFAKSIDKVVGISDTVQIAGEVMFGSIINTAQTLADLKNYGFQEASEREQARIKNSKIYQLASGLYQTGRELITDPRQYIDDTVAVSKAMRKDPSLLDSGLSAATAAVAKDPDGVRTEATSLITRVSENAKLASALDNLGHHYAAIRSGISAQGDASAGTRASAPSSPQPLNAAQSN